MDFTSSAAATELRLMTECLLRSSVRRMARRPDGALAAVAVVASPTLAPCSAPACIPAVRDDPDAPANP